VDQDGEVVDVFLQTRGDGAAAKRFFRRLIRSNGGEPRKIVTDKLRSYGVARWELIPEAIHVNDQYANNRVEHSHEPTRMRERGMRKFKTVRQAQRFLGTHATVYNLFNLGRHLVSANHYRNLRIVAFKKWSLAVARFWMLVYQGLEKLIWQNRAVKWAVWGREGSARMRAVLFRRWN
jgi:putative transposase